MYRLLYIYFAGLNIQKSVHITTSLNPLYSVCILLSTPGTTPLDLYRIPHLGTYTDTLIVKLAQTKVDFPRCPPLFIPTSPPSPSLIQQYHNSTLRTASSPSDHGFSMNKDYVSSVSRQEHWRGILVEEHRCELPPILGDSLSGKWY